MMVYAGHAPADQFSRPGGEPNLSAARILFMTAIATPCLVAPDRSKPTGPAAAPGWWPRRRARAAARKVVMAEDPDLDSLVARIAAANDRAAFADLFRVMAPRVKALMIRLGADHATADELAQETLLAVWRKSHLYRPDKASASTWVFAIARNLRIDRFRKENRPEIDPHDPALVPEPEPTPEERITGLSIQANVRACLHQLPADQRQAVQLSFLEGLSHQAIAERLDVPLGTVKSRLRLSMTKLRQMLRTE